LCRQSPKPCNLKPLPARKSEPQSTAWQLLHGRRIVGQPVCRRAAHIVAAEECTTAAIWKVECRRSVTLAEWQDPNRNACASRDGRL
jgi:hypothetical protein